MGLLTKLKSVLGLEREERAGTSGVDVTVEREAATESEEAVKETTAESGAETVDGDVDEPVASETEAAASTESLVDEEHTDDSTRVAETAEAASPSETVEETEVPEGAGVSSVKGIGQAYADRLHEAGVDTVADLAAADPEELAAETDLSEKRVGRWVEAAQARQ